MPYRGPLGWSEVGQGPRPARQASSHEHTEEECREKNRNALVTAAESYDFVRYRG